MFGPVDPYRTKCLFTLGCSFESIDDLRTAFLTLKDKSREQSFLQTAAACFEHELLCTWKVIVLIQKFLRALLDNNFLLGITRIEDYFNEMILSNVDPNFLKQQASSIFYTLLSRLEEEFPTAPALFACERNFFMRSAMSYIWRISPICCCQRSMRYDCN